jgi:membrane protease subunit HflC
MKGRGFVAFVAAAAVVSAVVASTFTVQQGQSALVIRLGMPLSRHDDPGLYLKAPFIDTVVWFERRLISLEPPAEQIILGDQKRIEASTYSRFRIADPLAFYQAVGSVEQGQSRLAQIVSSALRRELGQVRLADLLSGAREKVIEAIRVQVVEQARPLGVEVAEVRLLRADLPTETSQAIYDRMKSERQREAKELRAQGFQWAQEIQARADRQKTIILAEAQQRAKIVRGEADATASNILGDAYERQPAFYAFYRELQTYRQTLAGSAPTLLVSPSADFLDGLNRGPAALTGTPKTAP